VQATQCMTNCFYLNINEKQGTEMSPPGIHCPEIQSDFRVLRSTAIRHQNCKLDCFIFKQTSQCRRATDDGNIISLDAITNKCKDIYIYIYIYIYICLCIM
jgi:hypothetical protein